MRVEYIPANREDTRLEKQGASSLAHSPGLGFGWDAEGGARPCSVYSEDPWDPPDPLDPPRPVFEISSPRTLSTFSGSQPYPEVSGRCPITNRGLIVMEDCVSPYIAPNRCSRGAGSDGRRRFEVEIQIRAKGSGCVSAPACGTLV